MGGGFFVEVSEDGDPDDYHEDAEGEEAVGGGEEGPVTGEVAAEEGGFGEDKEHYWEVSVRGKVCKGEGEMKDLLLKAAVITWLTASKKKNLETIKVLTSMEKEPMMTARRPMMFMARIMLRMM